VILAGLFAWNIKLNFKTILNIVIVSESVFFLNTLVKLVWFGFVDREYSLRDLNSFHPLTTRIFLSTDSNNQVTEYLLTKISLVELAYICTLSVLLSQAMGSSFLKGFKIILSSYGVALALWTITVVFLLIIITT
jgi:hypothetical protein